MSNGKGHTGVKLDELLVRIMLLKNRIIALIKRILRLKGKIPDAEIIELIKRLENINTDYYNEDRLKEDEDYVNQWEQTVKKLEALIKKRIEEDTYTIQKENGVYVVRKNGKIVGSFRTLKEAEDYIKSKQRSRKIP